MLWFYIKRQQKNPKTKAGEGGSSGPEEYTRPGQKNGKVKGQQDLKPTLYAVFLIWAL